jgi:hypothetical protein
MPAFVPLSSPPAGLSPAQAAPTPSAGATAGRHNEVIASAGVAGLIVAFALIQVALDPGYFWKDDNQLYHVPGYVESARAWLGGEWPLLCHSTWQGGALAAEYLNGVFNLFLQGLLCLLVSLRVAPANVAAGLAIVHLAVLGMGAHRLGRGRGLSSSSACLVALSAALNGYVVIWGATLWLPALVSFAWLPWFWWALDSAIRRELSMWRRALRVTLAGGFLYLLVTAGWPYSVLMAGAVTFALMLQPGTLHVSSTGWRQRLAWAGLAWAFGLGLSAPAWLMLLDYAPHTLRGQLPWLRLAHGLEVPASALPGFVFPAWVTSWNLFEGIKPHVSAELAGGFVPVVICIAVRIRLGRAPFHGVRWEMGLALALFVLMMFPSIGAFRWSFRWLPLFFVVLGLMAGRLLDELRTQLPSLPLGRWALALLLPIWLLGLALGRDPTAFGLTFGLLLALVCLVWSVLEARGPSPTKWWLPVGVTWLASTLFFAQVGRFVEGQRWDLEVHVGGALDSRRSYLSVHTWEDVVLADDMAVCNPRRGQRAGLLPGNFAVYHGLRVVGGYSPHQPAGLTGLLHFEIHGTLNERDVEKLLRHETAAGRLLSLLGVDGLLVAERFSHLEGVLESHGWEHVASVPGGSVYHRRSPPAEPVFSWGTGSTDELPRLHCLAETRHRVEVEVDHSTGSDGVLVAFRRPWLPGYHAWLDGQELPVERIVGTLPAVRIPCGTRGRLALEYRPYSFALGLNVALATLGAVGLVAIPFNWRS